MARAAMMCLVLVLAACGRAPDVALDPGPETTPTVESPGRATDATEPAVDGGTATDPSQTAAEDGVAWTHLGQVEAVLDDRAMASAVEDRAALAEAWRRYGFEGAPPSVDFSDHLVLLLAQPDDACPDDLARLEVVDGVLEVDWLSPPGACAAPLILRLHAVAVHRGHVPATFDVPGPEYHDEDLEATTIALEPFAEQAPPAPEPPRAMSQSELDAVFAEHPVRRCTPADDPLGEPVVDGPLSDDPDVARAQQERAGFGVASDEATTRAVLADPDRDDTYGIPLTRAEVTADHERQELSQDVLRWLRAQGWRLDRDVQPLIDRHGDGRLHLRVAADRVQQLREAVDAEFGDGTVAVEAHAYDPTAIARAQRALDPLRGGGDEPGTVNWTAGSPGPLQIGMIDPTRQALDAVAELVSPALVCVEPLLTGVTPSGSR